MADFSMFDGYWDSISNTTQSQSLQSFSGSYFSQRPIFSKTLQSWNLVATALSFEQMEKLKFFFRRRYDDPEFEFQDQNESDIDIDYSLPQTLTGTIFGGVGLADLEETRLRIKIRNNVSSDVIVEKDFDEHFLTRGTFVSSPEFSIDFDLANPEQDHTVEFYVYFNSLATYATFHIDFQTPFIFYQDNSYEIENQFSALTPATTDILSSSLSGNIWTVNASHTVANIGEVLIASFVLPRNISRPQPTYNVVIEDTTFEKRQLSGINYYSANLTLREVNP